MNKNTLLFPLIVLISIAFLPRDAEAVSTSCSQVPIMILDCETGLLGPLSRNNATNDPRTIGVSFPDGDIVGVTWRRPDFPDHVSPPYGVHYDALRELAAEGDPHSAISLYLILDACKNEFDEQSKVTAAVQRLQETHTVKLPAYGDELLHIEDSEDVEPLMRLIQSGYDNCKPITAEQKSERIRWLEQASDGGPSTALLLYGAEINDVDESIEVLEEAWRMGNFSALEYLGQKLWQRYESGESPSDNVRAYAALYAHAKLLEHQFLAYGYVPGRPVERARAVLDTIGAEMHKHEILESIEIAKASIRENDACCFGS